MGSSRFCGQIAVIDARAWPRELVRGRLSTTSIVRHDAAAAPAAAVGRTNGRAAREWPLDWRRCSCDSVLDEVVAFLEIYICIKIQTTTPNLLLL